MIVANRTLNAPETYICKLPSEIRSREYECQKYIADVDSRMKRFTETEKWRDPWFRKLSAGAKLAFLYIIDNCDNAGVWTADKELADFSIGMEIPWMKVLEAFGERVSVLPSGDWLIVRFVEFQFGKLSKDCKPHLQVMRLIEKHRVSKGYPKGFRTLEEKDKEKEKDINGNDKYTKEITAQLVQKGNQVPLVPPVPPAALQALQAPQLSSIKESFDTEEDENENLIHNNKNKRTNISMTYKKLLNYIF